MWLLSGWVSSTTTQCHANISRPLTVLYSTVACIHCTASGRQDHFIDGSAEDAHQHLLRHIQPGNDDALP